MLGVDIGGTFTDVLALEPETGSVLSATKVATTPDDPALGALAGIDRFFADRRDRIEAVFHGTTVGTNALITKRAARTALLTTAGFRDVLALRRHARPRLYDLSPRVSAPLVPRERRIEVKERVAHDGKVLIPLTPAEIERVIDEVRRSGAEAVAVSLLHAYANDAHERALGAALAKALPDLFVSLSSEVCRAYREFERTSTVTVNAFIGPTVARYLDRLGGALKARRIDRLYIVKSNGGLTSAANARRFPVHAIESGPAAGIIAAAALGCEEGLGDLIAFDMGGTTAKVGTVIDGRPRLSTEFHADRFVDGVDFGGYPIQSPVIDLIEIGAGGGSIARLDSAGVLKVGPESAGAEPGPACYGRGGEAPTVTDAHVAIGHIAADAFDGEVDLDPRRAEKAIAEAVARPLGWSVPRAAWGILRLADARMAEMVRLATLRRGLDPRDFTLVAFGGAGPLHAAELAREVGIRRVVVPPYPGLFSAIGTVLGEIRHDLVQTLLRLAPALDPGETEAAFAALDGRARDLLAAEDVDGDTADWHFERHVDARFEGQLFELTLPVPADGSLTGSRLDALFRAAYLETYGYDLPDHPVQLVGLRLVVRGPVWRGRWPVLPAPSGTNGSGKGVRTVRGEDGARREVVVLRREALEPGGHVAGPAIVEDYGATIRILAGQRATVRPSGVLVIEG